VAMIKVALEQKSRDDEAETGGATG